MSDFYQHTTLAGEQQRWPVDLQAVATAEPWAARAPALLEADLQGMTDYFPHWLLVGRAAGKAARCPQCALLVVPTAGAFRCVGCWRELPVSGVLWVGQLPAPARPEARFAPHQRALREAGFPEVEAEGLHYLLVPLTVRYPAEWPNEEPEVRYLKRWLSLAGLPRSSAGHHLVAEGRACLFGWGEWYAMPLHSLLQQRVVNHLLSLLKIMAGQSLREAFIGRVAH